MEKRIRQNVNGKRYFDHVVGKTLIEIAGDRRVLVERHCGVLAYDSENICIKTTYGCVHVTGCNLCLSKMTDAVLAITGQILSVMMQRG